MAKGATVTVRAFVAKAIPDRTNYKPYATELTFGDKLAIDIEVPADEVIAQEKGGLIVLTAAGYASLLESYVHEIEKMNDRVNTKRMNPNR